MTTTLGRWPAPRANTVEPDDLLVAVGLVNGAQLRGRLGRRGAGHILDRLNNWPESMLQLAANAHADGTSARLVLARSELAWIYPLEVAGSDQMPRAGVTPAARSVLAHVGAFELRGTPQIFHQIDWADFLLACSSDGRFFGLGDVQIAGPDTNLHIPVVAVNAARVAALVTLD